MLARITVACMAILLSWGAIAFATPTAAQDGDQQATIEALQTKVAELEALLTPTPDTEETGREDPGAIGATATGSGLEVLPDGPPGELSVIAYGPLRGGSLPMVIRNNTDSSVAGITVNVEVRDSAGSLVAALQTSLSHSVKPWEVEPGGIAIGYILDNGTAPADATYSFDVQHDASVLPPGFTVNLGVEEATWQQDRVVGLLGNPEDKPVSNIWMNLVCLSDDGTAVVGDPGHLEGQIDPGGTVPFQFANGFSDYSLCERFLVSATAHPAN